MSNISQFQGAHAVDASNLQGKLIDLTAKQRRGLRTDRPNFDKAKQEITTQFPLKGAASGIPQDVFDEFVDSNNIVEQIDAKLAQAQKLLEVLTETRAFHVNARQNSISMIADAVQSRARRKKDPSQLAPFPETLKYVAQSGVKAAKSRKKNLEAALPPVQNPATPPEPAENAENKPTG